MAHVIPKVSPKTHDEQALAASQTPRGRLTVGWLGLLLIVLAVSTSG